MATIGSRWEIVMSHSDGFLDQVMELDFLCPSEGTHYRWNNGYRITSTTATFFIYLSYAMTALQQTICFPTETEEMVVLMKESNNNDGKQ